MILMQHQVRKGADIISVRQARWDDAHGKAFADLEVRPGDKLVLVYGWAKYAWWALGGIKSTRHAEELMEWLARCGMMSKPQILCACFPRSPLQGLELVDSNQTTLPPTLLAGIFDEHSPTREV